MKRLGTVLALILLSLATMTSCRLVNSILHDEEVVAKAGGSMLYKSEVTRLIPDGVSKEDSLRLAMQYINSWASDMVFLDIAEKQLSKTEKDVSKELEAYRRSLLKFRYEQLYVNERLDTTVTEDEIEKYYAAHSADFILQRPIVKACYMNMLPESPNFEMMKDLMSSPDEDSLWEAGQVAASSSDTFTYYSGKWVDATILAEDMGVDYRTLLPLKPDTFIETAGLNGKRNVAFVIEVIDSGSVPPVEYCSGRIEDIILSARKHQLTESLEQELLKDARGKGKIIIY